MPQAPSAALCRVSQFCDKRKTARHLHSRQTNTVMPNKKERQVMKQVIAKKTRRYTPEIQEAFEANNLLGTQVSRLDSLLDRIQEAVLQGLRITGKVQMTRKQWRGTLGANVRTARRICLQIDKVLNPHKYQKSMKAEPHYPEETLFDINGTPAKDVRKPTVSEEDID